jgi:hypothetical protein
MKKLLLLVTLFTFANSYSQSVDDFIALMKVDVLAEKIDIITDVMNFTDEQADIFWPIYTDYASEQLALSDLRIANIKNFSANYDSLTDAKADELINNFFTFQETRLSMNEEYYQIFAEALSPSIAAKYMQLESELQLLIDVGIASNMPLAKLPDDGN